MIKRSQAIAYPLYWTLETYILLYIFKQTFPSYYTSMEYNLL